MRAVCRPLPSGAAAIAGAAIMATALAALVTNPAQQHDVTLVDTAQSVFDLGQSEIATGTALYNQGDLANGLNDILIGENNSLIASPQDALLEQIETASQPYEYVYFHQDADLPIPTDETQLSSNIQLISEIGQNLLTQGSHDLAAGATNLGLGETLEGTNDLTVILPQEELYGPVYLSFANDPASYAGDPLGYLVHEVETDVIGPISTFAHVAGIDLGPVGGLLTAADVANTVNLFTEHFPGYLDGNFGDAGHIALETPQILFTAAGALTEPALPELSVGFDAIATGFGGLDTLLTNAIGY